jgi:MFS family permease|tara:strand:+ start:3502 stop:4806 length:1305 start_codon:yes stop_codon:yes gene_type:complete
MTDNLRNKDKISSSDMSFLCLLTLLNVLNMLDRNLMSAFANYIVPDLGLSNTEYGLLTGLVFLIFYSVAGLYMGMLADTVNRTRLISFGVTLWSALTAASGLAWNFVSMAIPRMFIGVGESILTPSAMSLLADRFPQSRLGFAAGFYYIGAPLGAGGSFLLAGYLGPIIGWRNCFYLLGGIGIVLAAIVFFVKETPRRHLVNSEDQKNTPSIKKIAKIAMTAIPKSPALMAAMAGAMLLHVFIGAGYFDQLWFVQERGFDRDEIAKLTGMMGLLGGLIGTFVGGVGSDWFTQKTGYGRLVFLFFVLLFCAPFMIAYRLAPGDSIWIPIGLFLGMFQIGSFFGPFFASIQGLIPPEVRSTVIAFSILLMNVIGMGIGITVTGISVDLMISYGINEPYSLTLICFTLFSFIAMPCFLFAGLRYNHDREKLNITESS